MKVKYLIYVVEDNSGNKVAGVVNEHNDTVQLCGLKDRDGNNADFESEFYHLRNFCDSAGLEFRTIDMDADV